MGRGHGGCEQRIEDIIKMQKKKIGGGSSRGAGHGGYEPRIEVIVKMQKRWGESRPGGVVGLGGWM